MKITIYSLRNLIKEAMNDVASLREYDPFANNFEGPPPRGTNRSIN